MTNTELLIKKINDSGLKKGFIAKELGITYRTLRQKVKGEAEFKGKEMENLGNILTIERPVEFVNIFFN